MTKYFKFLGGYNFNIDDYLAELDVNALSWHWTELTEIIRGVYYNEEYIRNEVHHLLHYNTTFYDFINANENLEIYIYSIRYNGGVLYAHDRYDEPPFDPTNDIIEISAIVI